MEVTIYLVRHGETEWNKQDIIQGQSESVLNQLGLMQAHELKEQLTGIDFSQIYSSPLQRAYQTAKILANGQAIETREELKEIGVGPMEGLLKAEAMERYTTEYNAFWNRPDEFELAGAESFLQLQERAWRGLERIVNGATGKVLVVSHGALIQALLAKLKNIPLPQLWGPGPPKNCGCQIIRFSHGHFISLESLST